METIPQKELRNHVSQVLRRVESGETFTVAGRPEAELGPVRTRRWVSGPRLAKVWRSPTPDELDSDLDRRNALRGARRP